MNKILITLFCGIVLSFAAPVASAKVVLAPDSVRNAIAPQALQMMDEPNDDAACLLIRWSTRSNKWATEYYHANYDSCDSLYGLGILTVWRRVGSQWLFFTEFVEPGPRPCGKLKRSMGLRVYRDLIPALNGCDLVN